MTLLSGQIAQFVIPSDAIGSPQWTVIDWPRQRFYAMNLNGIRSYSTVFQTQSPILSVATALNGNQNGTVDGNGNLIVQSLASFISNGQPVYKISPSTLLPVSSYGASVSGGPSYPGSVWLAQSIVGLMVNGVPYALIKESAFSPNVAIIRTDTMTAAGAYIAASGGTDSRSWMCPGANFGGNFATAFLMDMTLGGAFATVGIYKITINTGAETYNIASWPTPNPYISGGLLTNLAASAVDPTWTSMTTNSVGYDPVDGLVLVDVSAGNTVTNTHYLVALNATTGAVVWRLLLPTGIFFPMNLMQSRIQARSLPYLNANSSGPIYGIQTSNGNATLNTVNGLSAGTVTAGNATSSDDVAQMMISPVSYAQATGTPTPVSGTPSSFSGWAMIKVWPPFPIGITTATVADLWFAPTAGFVDITAQANRRKFVSPVGAAQNLAADGSAPFQVSPPVFLSSNGIPATFANNNGRGGTFVGGAGLTAGASNPPGASETTTSVAVTSPGRGVLGDYLTGNLYAFNPATLTDNGTQRRWLRRWRALPQASFAAVKFLALSIDMQTGTAVPNIGNPQLVLRWSDDGGRTWSDMRIVALGKLGQTAQSIKFNRLGATRRFAGSDRIFELSSSDPFSVAIIDAQVDAQ